MKSSCGDTFATAAKVELNIECGVLGIKPVGVGQGLNPNQQAALEGLIKKVGERKDEVVSWLWPPDTYEACLLRFLRARNDDVAKAWAMLSADLKWRESMGIKVLMARSPEEVAGLSAEKLASMLPMWHQGFCKTGRPVMFKHYGHARIAALLEHTSMENLVRFHVYENERASILCAEQSEKLAREIETVVYILDVDKWKPMGLTAALEFCKQMAKIDSDHYPERLGRLFVVNASNTVYYFWKLIRMFIDEKTRQKVEIHVGKAQWAPRLLEVISSDQLPPEYGGSGASGRGLRH